MFGRNKGDNVSKNRGKLLVKLTATELATVTTQDRLARDAAASAVMMRSSVQATWATFRGKYELPEEFTFDMGTGEVFEKLVQADSAGGTIPAGNP